MRWTKLAAACAAVTALITFAAPPALAQHVFHGAGYKLTTSAADLSYVTTTFRAPTVDCTGVADASFLTIGAFTNGQSAGTGVRITCTDGAAQLELVVFMGNGGYVYRRSPVQPGDLLRATISDSVIGAYSYRYFQTVDTTNGTINSVYSQRTTLGVASVGAYAPGDVPAFPTVTMSAAVNDEAPFTTIDHVRHVEYQGDTKVIGTGFPWNDGRHFNLYFKNH